MPKNALTTKQFEGLIKELKAIVEQGRKAVIEATKRPLVTMYWRLGEKICREGIKEETTIREIAQRLDFEPSLMGRIIEFYSIWPEACPSGQAGQALSWGHLRLLLSIKDERERNFYLTMAAKEGWGRNVLAQRIKNNYFANTKAQKKTKAQRAKIERKTNTLYLYSGKVERVVDGDTLLIHVDLGFDVWISKRVRLRGIDCPERSTPEGQRAKEFVENELRECKIVVIQTFKKIDIYGRYVCDVFYLQGETDKEFIANKGEFLNQKLLDKKLAVPL